MLLNLKYSELFENFNDSVIILELTDDGMPGTFLDANQVALDKLEYTKEEFLKLSPSDIDAKEKQIDVPKIMKGLVKNGKASFEIVHVSKSGKRIPVEISSIVFEENGNKMILSIARDVTTKKEAEEELKKSEERFRKLLSSSPVATVVYDNDGNFLFINKKFTELFGYTLTDIPNVEIWFNTVYPDEQYRNRIMNDWYDAIDHTRSYGNDFPNFNERVTCNDGSVKDIQFHTILGDDVNITSFFDITSAKENEKALVNEKDIIKSILDTADTIVLALDSDGNVSLINDYGCKLFGRSETELFGKNWFEFALKQPEGVEATLPIFRDIMNGKIEGNDYVEGQIVDKDGKIIDIAWRNNFLKNNEGKITATLSVGIDITEKNKAQREIQDIYNYSSDMFCIADFDGYLRKVNPSWERQLGFSAKELCSKPFIEFVHPDDKEITISSLSQLTYGNPLDGFENRYIDKNGKEHWLSWNSFSKMDEKLIFAVARDITEKKVAQQNFENLSNLNKSIIESSSVGIALYDEKGNCIIANDAIASIVKAPKEKLLEQNFHQIESWKESGLYDAALTAIEKGKPVTLETFAITTFNTEVWVNATFSTFLKENKPQLLLIARDVSDRKKFEQEIRETEHQLRLLNSELFESNTMKELLIDIMTHDLKNSAGNISSTAQLLLEENSKNELHKLINDSSNSLIQILDNAATLAKITDKTKLDRKRLNLTSIIKNESDKISKVIDQETFEIINNISDNIFVFANEIISQIFVNYIGNAIKYAEEGKKLVIENKFLTDRVLIKFSDFGQTIPQDKRELIFSKNFRIDQTNLKTGKGLGLAIVKRIAELHNAEVWVEPNYPSGNIFCFEMFLYT